MGFDKADVEPYGGWQGAEPVMVVKGCQPLGGEVSCDDFV